MHEVKQRFALSWNAAALPGLLAAWDVGGLIVSPKRAYSIRTYLCAV